MGRGTGRWGPTNCLQHAREFPPVVIVFTKHPWQITKLCFSSGPRLGIRIPRLPQRGQVQAAGQAYLLHACSVVTDDHLP